MSKTIEDTKNSKPSTSSTSSLQIFEYHEILTATENFDESLVIGSGGFGKVYRGNINITSEVTGEGLVVSAIKRLDPDSAQGSDEFWAEVTSLSMLHHYNIVSLIGYCIHEQEKVLVYEYMSNGSLHDHLHKRNSPFSWLQRLNICIGAACGLRHLHNDVQVDSGIIHRDIKSTNILLDESRTAKISDFGLSKTCTTNQAYTHVNTAVKGTHGYYDPSYYQTGMLTRKSDVFAFGVVMLELLCRKLPVDRNFPEWRNLVVWVQDSIKKGNLKRIIDPDIKGEISQQCLKKFVRIAEKCVHDSANKRPTMVEVVVNLESILALQEKFNESLQSRGIMILCGRMFNLFPLSSNTENSGAPNLSNYDNDDIRIASSPIRADDDMIPAEFQIPSQSLKEFRFDDLKEATKEFSPDLLLGQGGFGKVHLGWVDRTTLAPSTRGNGIGVAVKRLASDSNQGYDEWLVQVNFLGHMAHPNIIKLLGYCKDGPEHLLVYEYMANKSFDHFLHGDNIVVPISWETRLLIMIGVAHGLVYLHIRDIIHRDLKISHVFLNEDFSPKLGGFALAKYGAVGKPINTSIKGTFGYLDPIYFNTGQLSKKSDIYAFGVMLLASITARKAVDSTLDCDLVSWATDMKPNKRNLHKMMDPLLGDNYPLQGALKCVDLALKCGRRNSKDRPSSVEVLHSLEQISAIYK